MENKRKSTGTSIFIKVVRWYLPSKLQFIPAVGRYFLMKIEIRSFCTRVP